jgi:hypothetical protein
MASPYPGAAGTGGGFFLAPPKLNFMPKLPPFRQPQ